jgi:hypothetical protein
VSGQRWAVPYTAPGTKGGSVTVAATSREDALTRVIEIHRRRSTGATGNPSWRLRRAELVQIAYGEPVLVAHEHAQEEAS